MEQLADAVSDALRDEYDPGVLVGVSHIDGAGMNHVSRDEWLGAGYEPEQIDAVLASLREDVLAAQESNGRTGSRHASVHLYDDVLGIAVPLRDGRGVCVALDREGEYRIRNVVDTIHDTVHRSSYELHL